MEGHLDPKRVIAEGYDRMGRSFDAWNSARSPDARRWFLGEVVARLGEGSTVVELGCGPGTDAAELSARRRYVGIDLSRAQLMFAKERASGGSFVLGDFTSMLLRPESVDAVVAFYTFNHVPKDEIGPTFARIFEWLRPGGRLMTSLLNVEAEDRVEEWIDVPMFFAGWTPRLGERSLRLTGFRIELSELREEVDARYGRSISRWVIARKPVAPGP